MELLILGSEGFIGSNSVSYFTKRNHEVHCADIILKEAENYTVINPEFPDFAGLFRNQAYDVCINASGAANVQFSFSHAVVDYTLNVSNVFHLLEAIRKFNPKCKFINFSSAAVYGNPQYLPIDEDHPLNPISPYGWHKIQSENICREFFVFYKIPTLSLRVFSAYGPGLKKQLFWDLYQRSLKSDVVSIYGTGKESRDFIYIDDLMKAVELSVNFASFTGETINVANGEDIYISEISSRYFSLLNKNYRFTGEVKIGDPINWKADITLLKNIGYVKGTELQEGIKKYTKWLAENHF